MKALVVFQDEGEHCFARFLRHGFRHVAVTVLAGNYWVLIDPALGTPRIEVVAGPDSDLAGHYRDQGYTVIETETRDTEPKIPFVISNCVGFVKSVIGLRAPFILTPHQLFFRLSREAQ